MLLYRLQPSAWSAQQFSDCGLHGVTLRRLPLPFVEFISSDFDRDRLGDVSPQVEQPRHGTATVETSVAPRKTPIAALATSKVGDYPPMAAMRRTSHVMYVLRVMPRRRASLSMNSATSSSRVRPARTLLPEGRISGMETN